MTTSLEDFINELPYTSPFLFVDELFELSENGVRGSYTYRKDAFFYKGHFKNNPVTPGVILTETMAQIGVVCLGIYLLKKQAQLPTAPKIALTSHQIDFYIPVFPGEKVTVISKKEYFRFNKLKCTVQLFNDKNELVCKGTIAGMLISKNNET